MATIHKFKIETWTGVGDFNVWCLKMRALLLQQRCAVGLNGTWAAETSTYRRQELDDTA